MIIFYNKTTGAIVGSIGGRVHIDLHLNMWVGSREENSRLVVEWKQTGREMTREVEKEELVPYGQLPDGRVYFIKSKIKEVTKYREFEPQTEQKDIFKELDENPSKLHSYKIDLKSKTLILK